MYAPIQLRQTLAELDTVTLSNQQIILNAGNVIDENGKPTSEEKEVLERRFERLIKELLWYTDALKTAREKSI